MVVAKWIVRLLLTPEICGLNIVICKIFSATSFTVLCSYEKININQKEARYGSFKHVSADFY